ncbi:hypothetical protein SASPL_129148 [Salvia splendens]|uniref:Uncharacterized protein n=1 Tax=Salvia splendens TaxID=180675 RepID=A0A8X8ZP64_SALSN|nr:hypothetical protein SASPL_129148 [Salvia splendens]
MAVGWSVTLWMARMVWFALSGWVVSCLTVADELAGSLRSGDIGPFHVGLIMLFRNPLLFAYPIPCIVMCIEDFVLLASSGDC